MNSLHQFLSPVLTTK